MLSRKKKNLIVISLTVLLAVSAILILIKSTHTTIEQPFHFDDTSNITRIYMEDGDNHRVDLVRKDSVTWIIDGKWRGSTEAIQTSLLNALEQMRVREPVAKAAQEQVIRNLSTRSVRVDIYERKYHFRFRNLIRWFPHESISKSIYVGGETPDNMGTYMLLHGCNAPSVVHIPHFRGFLTTRFNPDPHVWRSHEICSYTPKAIQSIRIEIPEDPTESFEFFKHQNSFAMRLLSNKEILPAFDTLKATALLSSFSQLNYEGIANKITPLQRDTIFAKKPAFDIQVVDTNGKTTRLRTFVRLVEPESGIRATDKDNFYEIFDVNRTYGIVDGMQDTLVLQYFVLDNILRPASYYRQTP